MSWSVSSEAGVISVHYSNSQLVVEKNWRHQHVILTSVGAPIPIQIQNQNRVWFKITMTHPISVQNSKPFKNPCIPLRTPIDPTSRKKAQTHTHPRRGIHDFQNR